MQSTGKGLRGTFRSQRLFVPVVSSKRRHQASTLSGCVSSNSVFVIQSIFHSGFCVPVHLDSSSLNEAQNPKRGIGSIILSNPEPVIASFSLLKHNFGQKEEKNWRNVQPGRMRDIFSQILMCPTSQIILPRVFFGLFDCDV